MEQNGIGKEGRTNIFKLSKEGEYKWLIIF